MVADQGVERRSVARTGSDLEMEEEEQSANGLSQEEARYAARRAFGNTILIREQIHKADRRQ
jgi:hypothetical protein